MLFYLNTITVLYISPITGMLSGEIIFYARQSRASHELCRSESKKAKLEELSNNVSERRGVPIRWMSAANKRAAILSDTLVRSRRAIYWCIRNIVYFLYVFSDPDWKNFGLWAKLFRRDYCRSCILFVQGNAFGFKKKRQLAHSELVPSSTRKKVYMLREWFSFRYIVRRKKIIPHGQFNYTVSIHRIKII